MHPQRCGAFRSLLASLLLDAVGQLPDLVVDVSTFCHLLPDLTIGVHHRRMVSVAELLADLGQGQLGQIAMYLCRADTSTRLRLGPHRSSIERPK